ncbi:type IV pilus biogenesis protein PilP [Klebsiella pneumoniae]|uniref:Type IV pilus biogenesis protein PilP n=1 Tax=Klebsiella pneumoniae TaxID=573 RepID=A0A377VU86_KLEPN|nr:type IV pilus biogenesis protein PilP [Klebsiella pneumoniae]
MSGKRWIFLWLPLSLLAAERDPFQPVEDPCRTAQLSQWRYGGAVGDEAGWTGFLQDGTESGDGYAWMSNCPRAGG